MAFLDERVVCISYCSRTYCDPAQDLAVIHIDAYVDSLLSVAAGNVVPFPAQMRNEC